MKLYFMLFDSKERFFNHQPNCSIDADGIPPPINSTIEINTITYIIKNHDYKIRCYDYHMFVECVKQTPLGEEK